MAAPIGERDEIRPLRGSDSEGPTIRNVDSPEPSSTTTAEPSSTRWIVAPFLDDLDVPEELLEGLDAALGERLLAPRLLVLRVLAQVAELAGGLDAGHDGRPRDRRQLLVLGAAWRPGRWP